MILHSFGNKGMAFLVKKCIGGIYVSPFFCIFAKKNRMRQKYKVISLFSGCGGLDLGFLGGFSFRSFTFPKNSYDIIMSNDIDSATELVYNANQQYFHHNMLLGDVRNIEDKDIPDFDVLLAGFPCQPFSNAGQRKGVEDHRGTLYQECERFLKIGQSRERKPIAFVFENVRGILSSKMPSGITVPEEIVRLTKELGYNTKYRLVNASNFGVPSNRFRVIMVGIRDDLMPFDFSLMDKIVNKYNLPTSKSNIYELTLGRILCDIPADAPQRNDCFLYSPSTQRMVELIGSCYGDEKTLEEFRAGKCLHDFPQQIFEGRSWKNMNPEDMTPRFRRIWDAPKKYHAPNFYRRFALGEINGTITASAQPENCGITHPFRHRRYTIREAARIQSFPDDFTFPYTMLSNAYKVIGNAVPPILAWVIAKALQEHLNTH